MRSLGFARDDTVERFAIVGRNLGTIFSIRIAMVGVLLMTLGGTDSPVYAQPSNFNWADEYGKSPTQFTVDEWRAIIDAAWGEGQGATEQVLLFDRWWREVRLNYGAFHNVDLDVFALRDRYRPEIEAGVSRGRFAGIMSHFTYRLKELHTYLFDLNFDSSFRGGRILFMISRLRC